MTAPLSVPMLLLIPTETVSLGVTKKTYPDPKDGLPFFGSFRTFGGTEREINGLYSVENTATIDTWYRDDIKADCRIALAQTGDVFEIVGEPENIEMRNQYMRIRVTAVKGGA